MTAPYDSSTFEAFLAANDARIAELGDLFVKGVVQTVFNEVQTGGRYSPGTPIDEGTARANWVGGIGATPAPAAVEPTGLGAGTNAGAAARAAENLNGVALAARAGDTIHLANHLPYIRRLEYGWSKQAPVGMVRITLNALPLIADEVAAHLSGRR